MMTWPTAEPGTMVALGDSITVGVGDAVGPDAAHGTGWAAHLAALLGLEAFTNLATNGARSRDMARGQLPAALALRPGLATVLAGGNDVLRSDFDPQEVERDLRVTVSALREAGAQVVLVRLPTIRLFEHAPSVVRSVMRRRVAAVNAAIGTIGAIDGQGAARGAELVIVDSATAIAPAGRRAWHIDRVHPSPSGHRHLAVATAAALARLGSPHAARLGARHPGVSRLPATPPPPALAESMSWLVTEGLPWCVRRGGDFLPGLLRAVLADLGSRDIAVHPGYIPAPPRRPAGDTPQP